MRSLYESLLGADIEDKMQNSVADWVKDTVWSKSDIKNFIYKELRDKVRFRVPKNIKLVVDDYILLDENKQDKRIADRDNNRKDETFSYVLYGTNLAKLDLSSTHSSVVTTIVPWHTSNSLYRLTFRIRFGEDDSNKDTSYKWYWPEKDGQWIILLHSNKQRPDHISTWRSNFDGHIPSKDLR